MRERRLSRRAVGASDHQVNRAAALCHNNAGASTPLETLSQTARNEDEQRDKVCPVLVQGPPNTGHKLRNQPQ
jgi:hypothetical protein